MGRALDRKCIVIKIQSRLWVARFGDTKRSMAVPTPRCSSSIGFPGWPDWPHQRVNASRWPFINEVAVVRNFRHLRSGRPAAVYRREVLRWHSMGADGEGEAALPTRPDALLLYGGATPARPAMRDSRLLRPENVTGAPKFARRFGNAPRSTAWTGCDEHGSQCNHKVAFNPPFDPRSPRAFSARPDRPPHMCRWCILEMLRPALPALM